MAISNEQKSQIFKQAERRRSCFSVQSFFEDDDWVEVEAIARFEGPLSPVEMIMYKRDHDKCVCAHLLDFVFEIERLNAIIDELSKVQ